MRKEIKMKYIIADKGTFCRTIAALIVAILDLLNIFIAKDIVIAQDEILTFVTVIVGFICYFYNNTTSAENCEATGLMRLKKKQAKGKIDGEDFTDKAEESEVQ